jgi:non-specific serine/threonine protein kinase/serine/threonine-protein kinase
MLTPDYASPEQLAGESITTTADVYSLGVLLFELLTDGRPFDRSGMSMAEMARTAAEQEAPKPSSVAPPARRRQLAGDLDTIVLKAMHPVRERRYSSVEALADDIQRYLAGRPVHARPESPGYRLRKFVGRHRTSVVVGVLATAFVMVAAFTAVYQSAVAQSKDREARRRFTEIRELASGLLVDLDSALENVPGATGARELLARKVLHYLDGLARVEVRDASLQRDLAGAYERLADIVGGVKASNLGLHGGARQLSKGACDLRARGRATAGGRNRAPRSGTNPFEDQ